MSATPLRPTRCAICGTPGNATEVFPANFTPEAFNPGVFSARRLPDRIHYRMVRCAACGLVRSDPVATEELLASLYRQSTFDYSDEVDNLRRTYGRYLDELRSFGGRPGALLEIGCGNGFLLEEALLRGFAEVRGVEPGVEAVERAAPAIRPRIVNDMMRPGLFPDNSFDVVCLFQVLDHLPDPAAVLRTCLDILKPGGLLLCLNHNFGSRSSRLLGERSPIVDIEHTCLYDLDTMRRLFDACGFTTLAVGPTRNTYSLSYFFRLLPLPGPLKRLGLATLRATRLGRLRATLPLGNLRAVGRKPEPASP